MFVLILCQVEMSGHSRSRGKFTWWLRKEDLEDRLATDVAAACRQIPATSAVLTVSLEVPPLLLLHWLHCHAFGSAFHRHCLFILSLSAISRHMCAVQCSSRTAMCRLFRRGGSHSKVGSQQTKEEGHRESGLPQT
jgi:hypothetical protein